MYVVQVRRGTFQLVNNGRFLKKKKGKQKGGIEPRRQRRSKAQSRLWHACISANFHQRDSKVEREQQTEKLSSFLTSSFCRLHGSNSMLIPKQSNNFFNESWIKMWFATANENAFCLNAGVLIELRRVRRLGRALNNICQTLLFYLFIFCKPGCLMFADGPCCSREKLDSGG